MSEKKTINATYLKIEDLSFDFDSPRCITEKSVYSDMELVDCLASEVGFPELLASIYCNGYLETELILVIKQFDRYKIVDGNRRIAALKIIKDPGRYSTNRMNRILAERSEYKSKPVDKIPALIVNEAAIDIWKIRVMRHIQPPVRWSTYAHASYINKIRHILEISDEEIGRQLGASASEYRRLMQPLELIDYLIQLDAWQKEDTLIRRIDYTLLVEAFDSPALLHFIGWSYPIDPSKLLVPHAVELMQWLFGSERLQKRPIIDDAMKDIDRLEIVIGNPEALRDLRRSNDLEAAYGLAWENKFSLHKKLRRLDEHIRGVIYEVQNIPYKDEQAHRIAESVRSMADVLSTEIKK